MSYEDQQKALHPDLTPASELPQVRAYQLAARNARVMLKRTFPGVLFTVSGTSTGNGDVQKLRVTWPTLPNAPEVAQVRELLDPFARSMPDFNPNNNAFRRLFGEVSFLDLAPRAPNMEDDSRYLKQQLPKAPKVPRPRM